MQDRVEWINYDTLSLAIDESNHGQFPEIFCGVFSKRRNDGLNSKMKLDKAKKEKDFHKIISEVSQRAYSFLVVASKEDYRRIGYEEMTGIVAASLLKDTNFNFEYLRILVDGIPPGKGKYKIIGPVSEILGMDQRRILLKCGKDLDVTYPLVHFADGMARYLYRQKLEDIALNPNLKHLIK